MKPGENIGILGSGQLGRMLAIAARQMGYGTIVWAGTENPQAAAPTLTVADHVILKPFDDPTALQNFLSQIKIATVEFENVPVTCLEAVAKAVPTRPSPTVVGTCQSRKREKEFLRKNNLPHAPFALVTNPDEVISAYEQLGPDIVLKTAAFGYDGRGQQRVKNGSKLLEAWDSIGRGEAIMEQFIPFQQELSTLIARNPQGEIAIYDPAENHHREHILDYSIAPAQLPPKTLKQAQQIAHQIAELFHLEGLLGVEYFLLPSGELLVNEIAPRPHNSGHHTLNACVTSQFEQQLRAIADLPLGLTDLLCPVVMLNLLGDMWHHDANGSPTLDHTAILRTPAVALHLYGKTGAEARRKLGHLNILGQNSQEILKRALSLKEHLLNPS